MNVLFVYLVVVVDSKIYGILLTFLKDITSLFNCPELVTFDVSVISSSIMLSKLFYDLSEFGKKRRIGVTRIYDFGIIVFVSVSYYTIELNFNISCLSIISENSITLSVLLTYDVKMF